MCVANKTTIFVCALVRRVPSIFNIYNNIILLNFIAKDDVLNHTHVRLVLHPPTHTDPPHRFPPNVCRNQRNTTYYYYYYKMHPTFAVCNNGAHVIRLRLRLSLSWVTSVRVCATLPLRPPVRHVSFRLAYYDDETV